MRHKLILKTRSFANTNYGSQCFLHSCVKGYFFFFWFHEWIWVTNSCEWVTNLLFCESRKYAYRWITFYFEQVTNANGSVMNSGESCFRVIRVRDKWVRYRVIWHMDESRSNTKRIKYKNVSVTKSGVRASKAQLIMNDSRTHMME